MTFPALVRALDKLDDDELRSLRGSISHRLVRHRSGGRAPTCGHDKPRPATCRLCRQRIAKQIQRARRV